MYMKSQYKRNVKRVWFVHKLIQIGLFVYDNLDKQWDCLMVKINRFSFFKFFN
jgi:hypothetical protein